MDIVYYAVNIALFKILFLHTPVIAGWNESEMMIFISSYLLVDAVSMTVFSNNMWWLPSIINKGDLDFYLIRPVSALFFLSLREFSANSFLNLIIALGIFSHSLFSYTGDWSILSLFGLILLLINGTIVHYCLHMLMILPVFWTQSSRGFMDLFYSMGIAMERPHKIFKGGIRFLFTFILPFALIASFPAQIFIEGLVISNLLQLIFASLLLWSMVLTMWRWGLKNYSSASS
jgi:ABC-2 type transport system permease protein